MNGHYTWCIPCRAIRQAAPVPDGERCATWGTTIPADPPYQVLPPMHAEQYAALLHDIAERGVLTPIDLDEHGHILDGHHRIRACGEL